MNPYDEKNVIDDVAYEISEVVVEPKHGEAIAGFILGIVSIGGLLVGGIPVCLICGILGRWFSSSAIRAGNCEGYASIGKLLSTIGITVGVVGIIVSIYIFGQWLSMMNF